MTTTDETFAQELIAYWLSFVRTGNPNTHKLASSPTWLPYTSAKKARVVLQEGTAARSSSFMEIIPAVDVQRCAFVAGLADRQQN